MYVKVINKQMIPCIFNVKQYTGGIETIVFSLPRYAEDVDLTTLNARIVTSRFTVPLDIVSTDDTITVSWTIGSTETEESGSFNLQLVFADSTGEIMWRSYMASFVVSKSIAGGEVVNNGGDIIESVTVYPAGLIDNGIIEKVEV